MAQNPPPTQPVLTYPTPLVADVILAEEVSTEIGSYKALAYGDPHPNTRLYPNHKLVFQAPSRQEKWVRRVYAADRDNQDTYNYALKYSGNKSAFSIYVRSYILSRDDDNVLPDLDPDPVDSNAFLVEQEQAETTGTPDLDSLYVKVMRVYEVLPGPLIPFTRYDPFLGPIQGTRQAVANTGQVPSLTATVKTTYEGRDGSAIVSWKIVETNSDGTGSAGNPAYPTLTGAERTEAVRGRDVTITEKVFPAGTAPENGALIISSTVEALNQFLSKRRTASVASLPPDEGWAYWDFVPIPTLLFGITHAFFCNESQFFTLVTNYDESGGASVLRKHRVTVGYLSAAPNTSPDFSGSTFTTRDINYDGKWINIHKQNVLNDALAYDENFKQWSGDEECFWTEAYTFAASTPSATEFAAGHWYLRDYRVEPWGTAAFKFTKVEFYSAAGNPSIT